MITIRTPAGEFFSDICDRSVIRVKNPAKSRTAVARQSMRLLLRDFTPMLSTSTGCGAALRLSTSYAVKIQIILLTFSRFYPESSMLIIA